MNSREIELLAIGAGPSNLGLAVALEELAPDLAENSLIIERNQTVEWQSGMLLPWAKSQVSFLKDLATLRNPRSRFTFLSFLKATGRIDGFINMGSLTPYRLEISAYLDWVARSLSKVSVELGRDCVRIEPSRDDSGTLTGWSPRWPTEARSPAVTWSSVPAGTRTSLRSWPACPRDGSSTAPGTSRVSQACRSSSRTASP